MKSIVLSTAKAVTPQIYAYSTPEIRRHDGWLKIGYTEQEPEERVREQTHTADVIARLEWRRKAQYTDGSGDTFRDSDFHAYLRKNGVPRNKDRKNEWFNITPQASLKMLEDFKGSHGVITGRNPTVEYTLRAEQREAVKKTKEYFDSHPGGEFLWNAKPRFGKTLAAYDLVKEMGSKLVLIVTNRPAIANSWYDDYVKFLGYDSGYLFVSDVDALRDKKYAAAIESRGTYMQKLKLRKRIYFVSLQDLKGSVHFGGRYAKLETIKKLNWDLLIIDEAHEGIDTYKTDNAFDSINRKNTLHLSGTPYKAIANEKFPRDAIYNWTYADEQRAKRDWDGLPEDNPYRDLPVLNMYTYRMSEIIKDEVDRGIEINGEAKEYAFDLNEFFSTDAGGNFVYESSVDRFLDALTTGEKFPFSTPRLRRQLKHTLWLLNRVDSAKALAKKLAHHPVFSDYRIVLAAGDGKADEIPTDRERKNSYDKVMNAISSGDYTITLSVGQLTTGVTIPRWSGVLMLSNCSSPALYMQSAFRAQNPCLYREGEEFYRKENAYVFDFDPARTLTVFEQFANDLASDTANGKGDVETRRRHVKELLNFFPVIGEDEEGEMIYLDAEKVMSIPRRIHSVEVVNRGFMSNFLFRNISNIFSAPSRVIDIINTFEPADRPGKKSDKVDTSSAGNIFLDRDGEVIPDEKKVIGTARDSFGEKFYAETAANLKKTVTEVTEKADFHRDRDLEKIKKSIRNAAVPPVLDVVANKYRGTLRPSDRKKIERELDYNLNREVEKVYGSTQKEMNVLDSEYLAKRRDPDTDLASEKVKYETKKREIEKKAEESFDKIVRDYVDTAPKTAVRLAEKRTLETRKKGIEDTVRDHLRGFSRTIPSFLMAYGDDNTTLESFDEIIPDRVFKEVTGISLDDFRFLRDGGDYTDEDGSAKHYEGKLFDQVVFDDSVKYFLSLRKELSNYFDESNKKDIFDYIPAQRTNQIFTPKWVVQKMVDLLREENPGCFDDPDRTFADLYMKSGLYITEIVKRLYNSDGLKKAFPDESRRISHIFEKQVYGLAPTEIIYRISTNFILGFLDDPSRIKHHFRLGDANRLIKSGDFALRLDEIFSR